MIRFKTKSAAIDLPYLAMQNVAPLKPPRHELILFTAAGVRGEHGQGTRRKGHQEDKGDRETWSKEGSGGQKNEPSSHFWMNLKGKKKS
jgi:hypothetical protein